MLDSDKSYSKWNPKIDKLVKEMNMVLSFYELNFKKKHGDGTVLDKI